MLQISCWNVNSIKVRADAVKKWLETHSPDFLLLQELKCEETNFPYDIFEELNYNISLKCQKSYNGVAILSKHIIDEVRYDFPSNPCANEARFVEVTTRTPLGYFRIISVYVPNGGMSEERYNIKLEFLIALKNYLISIANPDEFLIIGGDFNVAPEDIDVYDTKSLMNTVCFTPIERSLMRSILNNDFVDLYRLKNPSNQEFTWWDYRAGSYQKNEGMRIDFLLSNYKTLKYFDSFRIDSYLRSMERPSDHIPISVCLSLTTG